MAEMLIVRPSEITEEAQTEKSPGCRAIKKIFLKFFRSLKYAVCYYFSR
jgi:hypothetical protein